MLKLENYIAITHAAKMLGCSRQFLYQLEKKGVLKGYALGRRLLLSREELENYITERSNS